MKSLILTLLVLLAFSACALAKTCPDVCHTGAAQDALHRATDDCSTKPLCAASGTVCRVLPCTGRGGTGFKCGCATSPGRCPGTCHVGDLAMSSASRDCASRPVCDSVSAGPNTSDQDTEKKKKHCVIRDCEDDDGRQGLACACPALAPPPPCPDVCRAGDAGKKAAHSECRRRPVCPFGPAGAQLQLCKVADCVTRAGDAGYKCGCPRPPAPRCPNTCWDGAFGEAMAKRDCARKPVCGKVANGPVKLCAVSKCFSAKGSVGFKCGCPDIVPPPPRKCPSVCREGDKGLNEAREECAQKRSCPTDGTPCTLKKCLTVKGTPGYECGCRKPKPCPNTCWVGKEGHARAERECLEGRKCDKNGQNGRDCQIHKCADKAGRFGYKCACPVKACPRICRGGDVGKRVAHIECFSAPEPVCLAKPAAVVGKRCEVQPCRDGTTSGFWCACRSPIVSDVSDK